MVVNADDPVVMERTARSAARRVQFSLEGRLREGFVVDGEWIVRQTTTGTGQEIPLAAVELTGRHMLNNVLAATAVSVLAGAPREAMVAALQGFHGLEHVMEPVGEVNGVRFVNQLWGQWATSTNWIEVTAADVNGDRRCDLVTRSLQTGHLWVALASGSYFVNQLWGQWSPAAES